MRRLRNAAGLTALLLVLSLPATADDVRYVGQLVDADGTTPEGKASLFSLVIAEITSDDQTLELAQLLHAEGDAALAKGLSKLRAGVLHLGEQRFTACVIRTPPSEEGKVVVAVADVPIHFTEAKQQKGVADHALGYVELVLDEQGRGSGRVLPASAIVFNDEGFLEARALGVEPLKIVGVHEAEK